MLNIVTLGDIMNNFRRSSYPLTQEWEMLAEFLAIKIKDEVEKYFAQYDSFEKIIENASVLERRTGLLENVYELLIYAAIKTRQASLLQEYLSKKLSRPVMRISHSEYLKPIKEIDEVAFLQRIQSLLSNSDFQGIDNEVSSAAD
ncbi:hypothetical protein [Flaviaesturariibacter amylovorans]